MAQVLAAAWVGVMVGWMGFGWALQEAPTEQMASVKQGGHLLVAEVGNAGFRS